LIRRFSPASGIGILGKLPAIEEMQQAGTVWYNWFVLIGFDLTECDSSDPFFYDSAFIDWAAFMCGETGLFAGTKFCCRETTAN
jgi:hypothetical protein